MALDIAVFTESTLKTPDDSLGFVLWRVTHAWQRFLDQELEPMGLTHLRFVLLVGLGWLTREGDVVTQRQLADFLNMHPMQVSQVLTALETSKLVKRDRSRHDRRAFALRLSAAGEAAVRSGMPIVEQAHQHFFAKSGFNSDAMRRDLLALLRATPVESTETPRGQTQASTKKEGRKR